MTIIGRVMEPVVPVSMEPKANPSPGRHFQHPVQIAKRPNPWFAPAVGAQNRIVRDKNPQSGPQLGQKAFQTVQLIFAYFA